MLWPRFLHARVAVVAALLLLPAVVAATTVTGTIKDPAGTGISGTLQLELSAPGITGAELGLIQPRVSCSITAGTVQTTPACTVKGNDTITSPTGTYYCVGVLSEQGAMLMKRRPYSITGATFNLGSASQLSDVRCSK